MHETIPKYGQAKRKVLKLGGRYFAKKPKNVQGGINSAHAKFPKSPKKVSLLPRNEL